MAENYQTPDPAVTERNWSLAIYVLYLLGSVTGVTGIIGVIMAHIKVNQASPLWRSHFAFQIRTFWWSVLFAIVFGILTIVLIGIPLLFLLGIWFIARCVVGLIKTVNHEPIPAPQSLLLGL